MKTSKYTNRPLFTFLLISGVMLLGLGFSHSAFSDPIEVTKFDVMIENVSSTYEYISSGTFAGSEPGPVGIGGTIEFTFGAPPGSKLSFATMYAQSNDAFFAPNESGIPLFDVDGLPISGDVTEQIMLWDAGTEVNQEPGVGSDQAPRQSAPDTGASESVPVQLIQDVNDGFTYPDPLTSISVMIIAMPDNQFSVTIQNISADPTFLISPGAWVIHTQDAPLFASGQLDYGQGIERIAEDGNPAELGASLATMTGIPVLISPGVWTLHTQDAPLFADGQLDYGEGLERIAEDGNPSELAQSLLGDTSINSSGTFSGAQPGPIGTGGMATFSFYALPGQKLSFATMYAQSNDIFYAPDDTGIPLFDDDGMPISGDVTAQVMLWDAGTEVNQQPGVGPDQAPRQSAPDTGASESAPVQIVNDGYTYSTILDSIRVTITATPGQMVKYFKATLIGAEDNTDSEATGTNEYVLSDDGTELSYKLTVNNIVDVTMSHIHLAPRGQAGPVIVWLYPPEPPAMLIPGTFSGVLGEGTIRDENLTGLLAGMTVMDLVQKMLNGMTYTNVHTSTYPAGEIRGQDTLTQEPPTPPTDYDNVFFMSLSQGLNMISLPLKPITPYTARTFAETLSATVVIKYDEISRRFMGFSPSLPGDGFEIEGGKGYIVNLTTPQTAIFTGAAWTNEPDLAPPASHYGDSAWAFLVSGSLLTDSSMNDAKYTVTVRNLSTNAVVTANVISAGYFSAVYADLNRNAVVKNQDIIEITLTNETDDIVSGPYTHKITSDEIRNAFVNIPLKIGNLKPAKSALLPNFPNPFNPETWLPYQLNSTENVTIKIYDSVGKLVRTLDLGQKDAGIYATQSNAAYWDGKNDTGEKIASGIYFYSIKAGEFSATRKMIVEK